MEETASSILVIYAAVGFSYSKSALSIISTVKQKGCSCENLLHCLTKTKPPQVTKSPVDSGSCLKASLLPLTSQVHPVVK